MRIYILVHKINVNICRDADLFIFNYMTMPAMNPKWGSKLNLELYRENVIKSSQKRLC